MKRFHADFYGASYGEVSVIGDFDPKEIAAVTGDVFNGWKTPRPFARIADTFAEAPPIDRALETLDRAVATVGATYEEELAPAITRVWNDELAAIARDLRGWVRQLAETSADWIPRYFELAFGLPGDPDRDPHSVPAPVSIDGRGRSTRVPSAC